MEATQPAETGPIGGMERWVEAFSRLWAGGRPNAELLVNLLGPEIHLVAPGLRSTRGREAALQAFRKTFDVLPDLTGVVHRWSASGDVLFLEMTFRATIGGAQVQWHSVDRVLFRDGVAVERVAFFNPLKVRRAFLRNPLGWMQLLRRLITRL